MNVRLKRPWIFQYTDKLTALSREVQTQMEEMFLNENAYSDGQILRKIRYYRQQGNTDEENKWWTRLTDSKTDNVKQLLKNEDLASIVYDLLEIPGLWDTVQVGPLNRILPLQCDEVILTVSTLRIIC